MEDNKNHAMPKGNLAGAGFATIDDLAKVLTQLDEQQSITGTIKTLFSVVKKGKLKNKSVAG